jgi:hypothetical protein
MMHDQAPTRSPSHPTMGGTFDRLVESNLELVRVMRLSIYVMVALTSIAIILAGYSAVKVNDIVTRVTANCGKVIQ